LLCLLINVVLECVSLFHSPDFFLSTQIDLIITARVHCAAWKKVHNVCGRTAERHWVMIQLSTVWSTARDGMNLYTDAQRVFVGIKRFYVTSRSSKKRLIDKRHRVTQAWWYHITLSTSGVCNYSIPAIGGFKGRGGHAPKRPTKFFLFCKKIRINWPTQVVQMQKSAQLLVLRPSHKGLCPWTLLGALPQTPVISSRSALIVYPQTLTVVPRIISAQPQCMVTSSGIFIEFTLTPSTPDVPNCCS